MTSIFRPCILFWDSTLSQGSYGADLEHISSQEGVRSAIKPFFSFSPTPIHAEILGTFAGCKAGELGVATRCAPDITSNLMHSVAL